MNLALAPVSIVPMIDATHANVAHVPATALKVAGYVTGTPDIQWTVPDWRRFPHAGHVRIDQRAGIGVPLQSDAGDAETGAKTIADLVRRAQVRHAHGLTDDWYFSRGRLEPEVIPAVRAAGLDAARIFLWLADWSLTQAEAGALVGQQFGGMTVAAVQWASPSSNPDTLVPGTSLTLREANVDLSETASWWHPAPSATWVKSVALHVEAANHALGDALTIMRAHGG